MPARPFPIADPRAGLLLSREPWLAPQDSFQELTNFQIRRGRIEKRPGSDLFGYILETTTDEVLLALGTGVADYAVAADIDNVPSNGVLAPFGLGITVEIREIADPSNVQQTLTGSFSSWDDTTSTSPQISPLTTTSEMFRLGSASSFFDINPFTGDWQLRALANISADFEVVITYEWLEATKVNRTLEGTVVGSSSSGHTLFEHPRSMYPMVPGTLTATAGAGTATDDTNKWSGDSTNSMRYYPAETISIDGVTTVRTNLVIWASGAVNGDTCTLAYQDFVGTPIRGIFRLFPGGGEEVFAVTENRIYRFNAAAGQFLAMTTTDPFTLATADDQYSTAGFVRSSIPAAPTTDGNEAMVVLNGKDLLQVVDPTEDTVSIYDSDLRNLDSDKVDAGNDLMATAFIVLNLNATLIFLRTSDQQGGDVKVHNRRARWTRPGQPEFLYQFDFADAPTQENIVSATVWRNRIIVAFTRSLWELQFTGNHRGLYKWVKISDGDGSVAQRSMMTTGGALLFFAKTGPYGFNGGEAVELSAQLDNIVLEVNPDEADQIIATRVREERQNWWAYPSLESAELDSVLVISEEGGQWQKFTLPGACTFGAFERQVALTVDDIDDIVDESDQIVDSVSTRAGFPVLLIGRNDGTIHSYPSALSFHDNNVEYECKLRSNGLNPFLATEDQRKARLSQLQLFYDIAPGATILLEIFRDNETAPHYRETISLDAAEAGVSSAKSWRMIHVNVEGFQHIVQISNTSSRKVVFDAIVPWFSEGGKIYNV